MTNFDSDPRLDDWFHRAKEMRGAEREKLLQEAAAAEGEAFAAALGKLLAADQDDSLADTQQLIAPPFFSEENRATDPFIGRRFGSFVAVRFLARGGFGAVYIGERSDSFQEKVAIKLIRPEWVSDQAARQRFLQERQALADLRHPAIASLLDGGGTKEDIPYLVMEYVDGETITVHCDNFRLPVTERIRLFCKVCHAVQHAHDRFYLHRDIKPSNILVTRTGDPKLLDFGIAKLIDPVQNRRMASITQGSAPLTPEYASPEQIRQDRANITTASDVYSLGVVLYELMTGRLPYQLKSRREVEFQRAVCEEAPLPPSSALGGPSPVSTKKGDSVPLSANEIANLRRCTSQQLVRKLRGDLETIILHALKKENHRRYQHAKELADDLERYLQGMPIKARPNSWQYRLRMFMWRRRWFVATAATVLLSIAAAGIAGWDAWQRRLLHQASMQSMQMREFHSSVTRASLLAEREYAASPPRALQLAAQSVEAQRKRKLSILPESEQLLRDLVRRTSGVVFPGVVGSVEQLAYMKEPSCLAALCSDGQPRLWRLPNSANDGELNKDSTLEVEILPLPKNALRARSIQPLSASLWLVHWSLRPDAPAEQPKYAVFDCSVKPARDCTLESGALPLGSQEALSPATKEWPLPVYPAEEEMQPSNKEEDASWVNEQTPSIRAQNGQWEAAADANHRIHLWETTPSGRKEIAVLHGLEHPVIAIQIAPRGDCLLVFAGSEQGQEGNVLIQGEGLPHPGQIRGWNIDLLSGRPHLRAEGALPVNASANGSDKTPQGEDLKAPVTAAHTPQAILRVRSGALIERFDKATGAYLLLRPLSLNAQLGAQELRYSENRNAVAAAFAPGLTFLLRENELVHLDEQLKVLSHPWNLSRHSEIVASCASRLGDTIVLAVLYRNGDIEAWNERGESLVFVPSEEVDVSVEALEFQFIPDTKRLYLVSNSYSTSPGEEDKQGHDSHLPSEYIDKGNRHASWKSGGVQIIDVSKTNGARSILLREHVLHSASNLASIALHRHAKGSAPIGFVSGPSTPWCVHIQDETVSSAPAFDSSNREDSLASLIVSPHGNALAALSVNGRLSLWQLRDKQATLLSPAAAGLTTSDKCRAVAFSPTGQAAIALATGTCHVFAAGENGHPSTVLQMVGLREYRPELTALAFDDTGDRLMGAGLHGLFLWHVAKDADSATGVRLDDSPVGNLQDASCRISIQGDIGLLECGDVIRAYELDIASILSRAYSLAGRPLDGEEVKLLAPLLSRLQ